MRNHQRRFYTNYHIKSSSLCWCISVSIRVEGELMNISIKFVSEQDGPVEREIKNELINIFINHKKPVRAYLALVEYDDSGQQHVCLCIQTDGIEDSSLMQQCFAVFKKMFSVNEHMDFMFLTNEMETVLRNVCCPFYKSPGFDVITSEFSA